jgi:polygalacturonase
MLNGHGGVVLGSEMSGDIRRIAISNCVFEGTDRGIRFKTMRGRGGIVEDVRVSNIVMHNIIEEGIVLNMRYQKTNQEPLSERTPTFRDIHLSNISISGAKKGISFFGLEERNINQVSFSDIFIEASLGIEGQYAQNLFFENVRIKSPSQFPVNFDKCDNITVSGLQLTDPQENSTFFNLIDCQNIKISDCFQPDKIDTFLKFNENCRKIYLSNNIVTNSKKILDGPDHKKITMINMVKK